MDKMTDAEIVCGFMEPRPEDMERGRSDGGWWELKWSVLNRRFRHWPNSGKTNSLDALHEVEARLTDEQQIAYAGNIMLEIFMKHTNQDPSPFELLYATAEQKLAALARVISCQTVSQ